MEAVFEKRGRFEIIYGILSFCRKPKRKTHILQGCNLSFSQIQKYLKFSISCGLLISFNKSRTELLQITEKGKKYLKIYEKLESCINNTWNKPNMELNKTFHKDIDEKYLHLGP